MLPELVIAGRTVPYYGLFGVLGFIFGILYILIAFRSNKHYIEDAIYMLTFGGIGALIGAKFLYLLIELPDLIRNWSLVKADPMAAASGLISGGFVFYGGLGGAIAGAVLTASYFKLDIKKYFCVLVPALCIVHAFGRMGCFVTGCCYGRETESIIGVVYRYSHIAGIGSKRLPVQLMESVGILVIMCIIIVYIHKKTDYGWKIPGLYFICYSVLRFGLEYMRGDEYRGSFKGLSTSQWISLMVFITGIAIMLFSRDRDDAKRK